MSNQRAAKISMIPRSILVPCRRKRSCTDATRLPHKRGSAIGIISLLGLLSIWLDPQHHVSAQIPAGITKTNATTYEDDRVKFVVGQCNRKLQELICQATLTSKNSDRIVYLNTNNVKLVDFEGNEYYPSLLKLANRTSENNLIRTELVENVPFKASFIFPKIPTSVNKIALLQIQLSGGIDINAKFRNLVASDLKPVKPSVTLHLLPKLQRSPPIRASIIARFVPIGRRSSIAQPPNIMHSIFVGIEILPTMSD
jgi:hypothetical protein